MGEWQQELGDIARDTFDEINARQTSYGGAKWRCPWCGLMSKHQFSICECDPNHINEGE